MPVPCDCCEVPELGLHCHPSGHAIPLLCCTPVAGATYEVDWQYAHRARGGAGAETAELRIGDAANPLLTNPVVDTHLGIVGTWVLRSGTASVPSGFSSLRFEFNSIGGAPGIGNFLDSCSAVLRRVLPTPFNFGEQLINGSFEFPAQTGGLTFQSTATPGVGWSTTDTCNCLEIWRGFSGVVAHTGNQHAEMNAFQRATLFQVTAPDTCESQVTWFDTVTGDEVPVSAITNCT